MNDAYKGIYKDHSEYGRFYYLQNKEKSRLRSRKNYEKGKKLKEDLINSLNLSDEQLIILEKTIKNQNIKNKLEHRKDLKNWAKDLFFKSKYRAKEYGVVHNLNINYVESLIISGLCNVTKLPFQLNKLGGPFSPSIDRIIPKLGYIEGNIQIVVLIYNFAKHNYKHEDIMKMAHALIKLEGETL